MKKLLFVAALLLAYESEAQRFKNDGAVAPMRDESPQLAPPPGDRIAANRTEASTTIWSEDFAGGIPAGWVQIDSSNINPWKWSTSGSRGFFNGTGVGQPSPGLLSTTRANGFLLNDPDSANHFTHGQPSGTTYQYLSSYIQTPRISGLAATPFIKLEFQQHFRMNNEISPLVQFSTDSANWTTVDVRRLVASNAASPDPMLISINLSNIVNGRDSLWIRFGWSSRVYYWMIDDIALKTLEDNDLSVEQIYLENDGRTVNYAQIPQKQLENTHSARMAIFNNGAVTQPNTRFETILYDGNGNTVSSVTSAAIPGFLAAARDTLTSPVIVTDTLSQGSYWLKYLLLSDSTDALQADNRDSLRLIVTDTVMALDGHNKRVTFSGTNSFTGGTDGLIFANYFELRKPDTITSVTVILSSQTRVGALLTASVRDTSGEFSNPSSFPVLLESDIYTVSRQDSIAGRAVIPIPTLLAGSIPQDVVLQPGDYFIGVEMYSNNDQLRVRIADDESVEQPAYASIIYMPANPNRWYTNGNAWGIRANFNRVGAALAVKEVSAVKSIKTYPNPQQQGSSVTIELALSRDSDWSVAVFDMQGRRHDVAIGLEKMGDRQQFTLSTDGLAAGIYQLRLTNGQEMLHQKLSLYK